VVLILVHGNGHNDPLLPLHPAFPISLAVVWDIAINRQNKITVISVTYPLYGSGSNARSILTPQQKWYQFLTTK